MTDERLVPSQDLLDAVDRDLTPVRPARLPWRRVLGVAPLGAALMLAVPLVAGPRVDIGTLGPFVAWGLSIGQLGLGLLAIWMALRDGMPSLALPRLALGIMLAAGAGAVAAVTLVTYSISPTVLAEGLPRPGVFCFAGTTSVGAPLLGAVALLMSRSLPSTPMLAGGLYGMGAGLTADAAWRLGCPVSDPTHVLSAHAGAVLLLAVTGMVWGMRGSRT